MNYILFFLFIYGKWLALRRWGCEKALESFLIVNVMILKFHAGMFWSLRRQLELKTWKQKLIFPKLRSPNNMQIFFSGQFQLFSSSLPFVGFTD